MKQFFVCGVKAHFRIHRKRRRKRKLKLKNVVVRHRYVANSFSFQLGALRHKTETERHFF